MELVILLMSSLIEIKFYSVLFYNINNFCTSIDQRILFFQLIFKNWGCALCSEKGGCLERSLQWIFPRLLLLPAEVHEDRFGTAQN
jgi:hypothetical protein